MYLYHMISRINGFGLSCFSSVLWGQFIVGVLYLFKALYLYTVNLCCFVVYFNLNTYFSIWLVFYLLIRLLTTKNNLSLIIRQIYLIISLWIRCIEWWHLRVSRGHSNYFAAIPMLREDNLFSNFVSLPPLCWVILRNTCDFYLTSLTNSRHGV